MNAKEYLEQYQRIEAKARIYQQEIERIRTQAEGLSINLDGLPKGSGARNDKMERLAVQLAEYETKFQQELSRMWSYSMGIINALDQLQDQKHQTILYRRYIKGETWECIAYEMGISWRHCYRLHGRALQKFEEILNK